MVFSIVTSLVLYISGAAIGGDVVMLMLMVAVGHCQDELDGGVLVGAHAT